jgi:hypothetical protein
MSPVGLELPRERLAVVFAGRPLRGGSLSTAFMGLFPGPFCGSEEVG